ncbi:MAG: transferase hexapeptide repeat protein [Bacillota bacterium]|jgi:acetyltransferase EpsM|nr:transferase hexapeptide repeat protein [Bacillota bacterium]
MKRIIIIGTGGNAKVVLDAVLCRIRSGEELILEGFLDDNDDRKSQRSYPILGTLQRIDDYRLKKEIRFVNAVGNNLARKRIFERYPDVDYDTVVHPSVLIGTGVVIGAGSVVMAGAIINADSFIGKQALINTGAIIEHDNRIGDFVHVASGAATAGNVRIGSGSMLGTGAKVIQGISIGSNAMIGAGAVVISDIPDGCTAVGVPARVIR